MTKNLHQIVGGIEYKGDSSFVSRAISLMQTSQRPLPARYCGGDFHIPGNPLSDSEQYELAGSVMIIIGMIEDQDFKEAMNSNRGAVIFLGESIGLGTALVKKLGGSEEDIHKIIKIISDAFREKVEDGEEVIKASKKYMTYCENFSYNTTSVS